MRIVNVQIDSEIRIVTKHLSPKHINEIQRKYTYANPEYFKKKNMGLWVGNTSQTIRDYRHLGDWLIVGCGCREEILQYLTDNGYKYEVSEHTISKKWPTKIKFNGNVRDYQMPAVQAFIDSKNGILRGPPGCGKTVMLIATIAKLNSPTLVVVHNQMLLDQWCGAIAKFLGFAPNVISGSKTQDNNAPVTVAMQQKLINVLKNKSISKFTSKFSVFVGDEVHRWAANTFLKISRQIPARYRLGVSADERRKDGKEFLIHNSFGPTIHEVDKTALKRRGKILPITMHMVETDYVDYIYRDSIENGECPDWVTMISMMDSDDDRNKLIYQKIVEVLEQNKRHRILVLCSRRQRCIDWHEDFQSTKYPSGLMIGASKTDCERSMAGLMAGRVRVAFGTTVADEAIDIPPLTHVFVTYPVHTHLRKLEQMVGRCARPHGIKKNGFVYYFWDSKMFPLDDDNRDKFLKKFEKVADKIIS